MLYSSSWVSDLAATTMYSGWSGPGTQQPCQECGYSGLLVVPGCFNLAPAPHKVNFIIGH